MKSASVFVPREVLFVAIFVMTSVDDYFKLSCDRLVNTIRCFILFYNSFLTVILCTN